MKDGNQQPNNNGQYQQYPNSGQQYQQYPNSAQQYQQYPNSGQQYQQYPNSGQQYQQYPNSAQQYQQYPNSAQQYPNMGQQYQNMGYNQQNEDSGKGKTWLIIAIAVGAIFLIGVISVLLVQLRHTQIAKDGEAYMNATLIDYDSYKQYEVPVSSVVIDGSEISLPQYMLNMSAHYYISLKDFAAIFGYDTSLDKKNKQTTITNGERSAIFSLNVGEATVTDNGSTYNVLLLNEPLLFSNDETYVPLKSMQDIFNFKSLEWDENTRVVEIQTNGIIVPVV